jgi:UDP-2-acetamido-3-amino-2,3-dideoxy-glucuronate N-acetyltransferase
LKGKNIHPTADVSPEASIGEGSSIWHYTQVREGAQIGRNCILGKGVYVDFDVVIGDNCKIQNGVFVYNPAVIEDGVFLGPGAIITNDKRPRAVTPELDLKSGEDWVPTPVIIEKGASIGAGAILLPGITIGSWAMVAAGSVVTRDVRAHGLAVGNPAKITGFICRCGIKLQAAGYMAYRCPNCRRTYDLQAGLISERV